MAKIPVNALFILILTNGQVSSCASNSSHRSCNTQTKACGSYTCSAAHKRGPQLALELLPIAITFRSPRGWRLVWRTRRTGTRIAIYRIASWYSVIETELVNTADWVVSYVTVEVQPALFLNGVSERGRS